tara:strand:- start:851 stop:1327 length:477 start_codon:yes stop_codon:yes gene_type:complete
MSIVGFGGQAAFRVIEHTGSAFDGGTGEAHGDKDAANTYTIFTVTDNIVIWAFAGLCNTSLVGAGTLEVGVAGNTAKLLAQIANTTTLDDGDVWTDANTEAGVDIAPATGPWFINDGANIVETCSTADITAGQVDYVMVWTPCNASSNVVNSGTLSQV